MIINKGKIVADEKTENISRAIENNRRFNVKISGPQREVLAMLKSKPGIVYAEVLAERDGDAYTYMIESEAGIDIRKNLFYTLAEKNWPLIGMEALGMSLEDIFIGIVDKSDERRSLRGDKTNKSRHGKAALENQIATDIMKNTRDAQKNDTDIIK